MAQVGIETGENLLAAIDERGLDAKTMEYVRELNSDITATCDGDRFRQLGEMERFIGTDAIFMARHGFRHRGVAARRNQYLVGRYAATLRLQFDGMLIDQFSTAGENLDFRILEPLGVEPL